MIALNVSPIMLTFRLSNICRTEYNFRFFSGYTFSRIVSPINKPMEYDNKTIDNIFSIFSRFWFIIFSILSKFFISRKLSSIFIRFRYISIASYGGKLLITHIGSLNPFSHLPDIFASYDIIVLY